ncbi:ABC transporter substrate-binding protein [Microbacterium sp. NC79]|uniref:ABC transporter substrate-binding protein n=1 Tax=Microbacterium sp. NC79 TaxID=2851009 RepID=UPI001C2C04DD|nr:ABC transporter substrate-binding protein [Microbacterium sp. NC79]
MVKTNAWEQVLFGLMWNGLVKTNAQGEIEGDLAESWSSSDDLMTWTFKLRSGVEFSNGNALTAQSVVDTIAYYQDPDTATQLKNNVAPIKSVSATSETEVVFTLDAANALFPQSIELVKVVDKENIDELATKPAVTGPYMVKEFVTDDHLLLTINPDYFGEKPAITEIDLVKAADSSAAVTALQSGDLDVVWSVPLSQVASIEGEGSLQVISPELIGQYVSWEVDMTSPPFNDVRARQALAYAIDRDAILANAYYGQGVTSPTNNPLTENNPAFGGDLTDYSYDLDKAKSLFAEAGIKEGDSIIWWGASNAYPEWNTSAQILQASLKEIGITLDIQNTDIATWPSKFYPAGQTYPNMVVPNFQSYQAVPSDLFLFLQSGRCECNWNSTEFDDLYASAITTGDVAEQNKAWAKVQELMNQEVPIYVPVQFTTVTAATGSVTGIWVDSGGTPHFENAKLSD